MPPASLLQRRTLTQPGNGLPGVPLTAAQVAASGVLATALGGAPIASPAFTGVPSGPAFNATGLTGATAGGRYVGTTTSGAPASGTFLKGDWCTDQTGKRFTCTVAGSPGTWLQEPGSAASSTPKVVNLGVVSGAITCDLSLGVCFVGSQSGNITGVTFTNWPAAPALTEPLLILTQAAPGGFTIILPSVIWAPSGAPPTFDTTAGDTNIIPLSSPDQGTHIYGGPVAAPLVSPQFTGTPTAPTPTPGDNSTKLATTAYVLANAPSGGGGSLPQVDGGTPSSTYSSSMDGGTP
jgi:hypothetical protein